MTAEPSERETGKKGFVLGTLAIVFSGILILSLNMRSQDNDQAATNQRLIKAKELMAQERYAEAAFEVDKLIQQQPKNATVHKMMASLMLEADKPDKAFEHLKMAAENAPNDYEIQQMYGEAVEDMQGVEPALPIYDKLMERFPDKLGPVLHAAFLREASGQENNALQVWKSATDKHPKEAKPWIRYSRLLAANNRYAESLSAIRQAQKNLPSDATVKLEEALLLATTNKKADAESALSDAISRDPSLGKCADYVRKCLASGKKLTCVPLAESASGALCTPVQINGKPAGLFLLRPDLPKTEVSLPMASKLGIQGTECKLDTVRTGQAAVTNVGSRVVDEHWASNATGRLGKTFFDGFDSHMLDKTHGILLLVER